MLSKRPPTLHFDNENEVSRRERKTKRGRNKIKREKEQ